MNELQPHQARVVLEKAELDEKRSKLNDFFSNRIYLRLPLKEQNLLRTQYEHMTRYSEVLGERITAFSE